MGTVPTSLAGASWLTDRRTQAVFTLLDSEGEEGRVVGGAVRNALFGVPVRDLDFATTATPEMVTQRAEAAGYRVVPTGFDHGTVTVVVGGRPFEVTTLREDIETDGRHAVVRFGRDWTADAWRRDFTVNALSVSSDGTVHDPLGGYDDVEARRIRFIGDPERRIAEDRLRILRFFRFHAEYGEGELDEPSLSASIHARHALRALSAERVGHEMRRLVVAKGAAATLEAMQDSGILPVVFGGVGYVATFRRLVAIEEGLSVEPDMSLRLAALGCRIAEDAERLTAHLRLSNAERDRMLAAVEHGEGFRPLWGEREARHRLYRLGPETYRDAAIFGFLRSDASPGDAGRQALIRLPERWQAPSFPISGRDILAASSLRGPSVGALLGDLEAWWIERDFVPDEAALRARLQQMIASAQ